MTLTKIPLPLNDAPLPENIDLFLKEAIRQIAEFKRIRTQPIYGFESSCFESCYRALSEIQRLNLSPGNRFCEWGSGLGVNAILAALLGFESFGIEIHPELSAAAQALATSFHVKVHLATGSFLPRGSERLVDRAFASCEGDLMLETQHDDTYEQLGMEVSDFDVIFAYPWPGATQFTSKLFNRFASTGALLLTYNGRESMQLQRKIG